MTVIGVDVGGTFTDLFLYDEATGKVTVGKVPSTRGNQSVGFVEGIRERIPLAEVASVVHGTTVGTNALLERKGARAGLITTRGFRDVLEMRRRDRRQTWGLWGQFVPVIQRDLRLEVGERTLADGTVLEAIDPAEIRAAARALLDKGCEAVCVVFINAYANPANERAALDALRDVWPNEHANCSSAILPEIREFERTSTTAINAYLQPVVGSYLGALETRLKEGGFAGDVLIVQSNGGVMTVDTARALPVRTALSGPAAGVIAAAAIARGAGFPNVITGDVGGTSFDVSLIVDGTPQLAAQTTLDFGLVVRTPMVEISTIGAGGGSIAGIDRGGLLQVGPESAGSDPGPVCYGLGNDRPTVTDANVVMGRINAERPIGGKLARLDVDAARRAIEETVAKPLGLDVMAAAEAIVRVANARMAGAIRLVSIERGHDPKRFALMPFGGGGALHACALIREVGLASALVPRFPGVNSSMGCIIADMRHDRVQTINATLDGLDVARLTADVRATAAALTLQLDRSGMRFEGVETLVELDMSYVGQTHTVAVPLALPDGRDLTAADVRTAFEAAYRGAYGRLLDGLPMRLLNLRTAVVGRRPAFALSTLAPRGGSVEGARRGVRRIWAEGAWHEAAVLDRLALPAGAVIPGPAVLEQPDSTIVVEPDMAARVDPLGNLVIERKP
ncbi:MAG: hydantoinase/oxoprolinase family protein [Rhodospirillales bacterium]